jgi:Rrf2 family protein
MLAVFFFAGVGNASTFKQIPMLFEKRQAGGVIGWTAAIAAYGPFVLAGLMGSVIAATGTAVAFFWGLAVFFAAQHGLNWWFYARRDIPPSFVPQVLAALVRAGIAESHSGRGGGYRLSSSPAEVSLLQVIQAATGELASETCVLRGGPCDGATMCAVHVPWLQAQQALLDALDGTTLEDLVVIDAGLRAGTFEPPVGFGRAGSAVATVR